MSQFEFIAVLVSVVTGLGIVRLLSGIAQLLNEGVKPYWIHLLWTWNVFQFIVFYWWFFWRWSAITEWNLLLFLFVLIYAVVVYLMCALLYPAVEKSKNFELVFYEKKNWFFGFWVLVMTIDIVDTVWKTHFGLSGFGVGLAVVWGLVISGSIIAALTTSRRFHATWSVTFLMIMSTFEYLNWSTLRAD